jgi:hypothetical protein
MNEDSTEKFTSSGWQDTRRNYLMALVSEIAAIMKAVPAAP